MLIIAIVEHSILLLSYTKECLAVPQLFLMARRKASCEEALKNSVNKMEKMSRKNAVSGA
jgi:hypothetical protein